MTNEQLKHIQFIERQRTIEGTPALSYFQIMMTDSHQTSSTPDTELLITGSTTGIPLVTKV